MQPLKTYDYLTRARQRVFEWVRPLSAGQYGQEFPIGRGTLGRTLSHIMICEWYYVERMQQHAVPPYEQWAIQDERPPAFPVLEAAWIEQAGRTRAALSGVRNWDAEIEYQVSGDQREEIVTASVTDLFTQLVLHETHHRAQAMNMFRHLGVAVEDIDFNTLMYKRRAASL